ncbi:hypothetical protein FACS189488_07610 [Betaproteobacteria bacterium]|nr:hypothetical protein FACS189488_07610 [Betaproteobacteria bacterium]
MAIIKVTATPAAETATAAAAILCSVRHVAKDANAFFIQSMIAGHVVVKKSSFYRNNARSKRSAFHHPTDPHKQPPPQRLTDVRAQTHDGEDAIAPEKRPRSAC